MGNIGVIVYEILPDGCLNGIGSDNHPDTADKMFNEIARKDFKDKGICGTYKCGYMEMDNEVRACKLEISRDTEHRHYTFLWSKIENGPTGPHEFHGIGWKTKKNQIAVSYWW